MSKVSLGVGLAITGAILTTLSACSGTESASPESSLVGPAIGQRASNALAAGYLPIGTIVPPGREIYASPQLPDRSRGDIVPLHDPRDDHVIAPARSRWLRRLHAPGGDGADRGIQFLNNNPSMPTIYGMGWNPEVNVSRTLPAPLHSASDADLFAPTALPPGGSCIEANIATIRDSSATQTDHYFGIYNWCTGTIGAWQSLIVIDSTFETSTSGRCLGNR
jgi:hypothetical protein